VEDRIILDCGCEYEEINGRSYWVYCDEHDVDVCERDRQPLTKFRKSAEDYA
jgi:hypothetical protein